MKPLCVGLVLASILVVGLKLFTFEFFLADDPTTGIAARLWPGLDNRRLLQNSSDLDTSVILFSDENDFSGSNLYRFIVSGGWLGIVLLTGIALTTTHAQNQR